MGGKDIISNISNAETINSSEENNGQIDETEVKALNDLLDNGNFDNNNSDEKKSLSKNNDAEISVDKNNIQKELLTEIAKNENFAKALLRGIQNKLTQNANADLTEYTKLVAFLDSKGINAVANLSNNDSTNTKTQSISLDDDTTTDTDETGVAQYSEAQNEELSKLEFDETTAVREVMKNIQKKLNLLKDEVLKKGDGTELLLDYGDNLQLDKALSGLNNDAYQAILAGLPQYSLTTLKNLNTTDTLETPIHNKQIIDFFIKKFGKKYSMFDNATNVIKIGGKISFLKKDDNNIKILGIDDTTKEPSERKDLSSSNLNNIFGRNAEAQKSCPPGFKFINDTGLIEGNYNGNTITMQYDESNNCYLSEDGKTIIAQFKGNKLIAPPTNLVVGPNGQIISVNRDDDDNIIPITSGNNTISRGAKGFKEQLQVFTDAINQYAPMITYFLETIRGTFGSDNFDNQALQLSQLQMDQYDLMDQKNPNIKKNYFKFFLNENPQMQILLLRNWQNDDILSSLEKNDFSDTDKTEIINILQSLRPFTLSTTQTPDNKQITIDPKTGKISVDGIELTNGGGYTDNTGKTYTTTITKDTNKNVTIDFTDSTADTQVDDTDTQVDDTIKIGDKNLIGQTVDFSGGATEVISNGIYFTKENDKTYAYDFKEGKKYQVTIDNNDKITKIIDNDDKTEGIQGKEISDYKPFFDYTDGKVNEKIPKEAFEQNKELCKALLEKLKDENNNNDTKFNTTNKAKKLAKAMIDGLKEKEKDKDNKILNIPDNFGDITKIEVVANDGGIKFTTDNNTTPNTLTITNDNIETIFNPPTSSG